VWVRVFSAVSVTVCDRYFRHQGSKADWSNIPILWLSVMMQVGIGSRKWMTVAPTVKGFGDHNASSVLRELLSSNLNRHNGRSAGRNILADSTSDLVDWRNDAKWVEETWLRSSDQERQVLW
jgi:hypothetical protein